MALLLLFINNASKHFHKIKKERIPVCEGYQKTTKSLFQNSQTTKRTMFKETNMKRINNMWKNLYFHLTVGYELPKLLFNNNELNLQHMYLKCTLINILNLE